MKTKTKNSSGLKALVATIVTIAAMSLLAGCDEERVKIAERERDQAQTTTYMMGAVLLVGIAAMTALAFQIGKSSGDSTNDGGDSSGGGPGTGHSPTPRIPTPTPSKQQDQAPAANYPRPRPPVLPRTQTNGSNGASSNQPAIHPSSSKIIPIVATLAAAKAVRVVRGYVIIDGLNICRSNGRNRNFRLQRLLGLITECLNRGIGFECVFDGSTPNVALSVGDPSQRTAYDTLIVRYPELFAQVPGGERADGSILRRAQTENCRIVSCDRFRNQGDTSPGPTELEKAGRLIKGRELFGRLVFADLEIDVPIETDLDAAVRAFETALRNFQSRQSSESRLAA